MGMLQWHSSPLCWLFGVKYSCLSIFNIMILLYCWILTLNMNISYSHYNIFKGPPHIWEKFFLQARTSYSLKLLEDNSLKAHSTWKWQKKNQFWEKKQLLKFYRYSLKQNSPQYSKSSKLQSLCYRDGK